MGDHPAVAAKPTAAASGRLQRPVNGLLCLGIVAVYRLARWLCSDRTKLIVFAASGMARLRESTLRLLAGFMVVEYALVWLFCAHLPWHCP